MLKEKKIVVEQFTETTTASGAFAIPSAVKNGKFVNSWGSSVPYMTFRRDADYIMVKDVTNLSAIASTSVTLNIAYVPA